MTIQSVQSFLYPDWHIGYPVLTAPTLTMQTAATLDAASEAFMWCGDAPATGSLTDVYFRIGTTAITSGPLNFDVRIEQVTNGRPNGSLLAANTNGNAAIADTDDNSWKSAALTSAASVTRGTPIGIVVKAPGSGTFSVIWSMLASLVPPATSWPLVGSDTDSNGTYDSIQTVGSPCLLVKIDGVIYHLRGCIPYDSLAMSAYNSGSSPDEKALRIVSPVPLRVVGMEAFISNAAAGADFTFSIWPDSASSQSDGNALVQVAHDGDAVVGTTQDGFVARYFASAVTLSAGTVYWAGCRADTANNIAVAVFTLPSITGVGAAAPGGSNFYMGTRAWSAGSAAAFTTDTSSIPLIRLIVDGIDDGVSSVPAPVYGG